MYYMKRLAPIYALIALLLSPSDLWARGYAPIACGMDLNHNGVFGEPADCGLCNGTAGSEGYSEWYVSADTPTGVDNTTCGTAPGTPCRTLNYAISNRVIWTDSTPDAICGHGTFTSEPIAGLLIRSGQPGVYSVAPTGNQRLTWKFALKPTIIMAWDKDGDGDYFPHDADDNFDVDGCSAQGRTLFQIAASGGASYFEIAHMRARNYGSANCIGFFPNPFPSGFNAGTIQANGGPSVAGIHDSEFIDFGRGQPKCSEGSQIRLFTNTGGGAQIWNYFYIRNSTWTNRGGYLIRGGIGDTGNERGPLRVERVTDTVMTCDGCTAPQCNSNTNVVRSASAIKVWALIGKSPIPNGTFSGDNNGIEVIDSIFDSQAGIWHSPSNSPTDGYGFNDCQQNAYLINNEWIDWKRGVVTETDDSFCNARENKNLVIDKSVFRQTPASPFVSNGSAVGLYSPHNGVDASSWNDGISVTNSFFYNNRGAGIAIEEAAPGAVTRTLPYVIDDNTFDGDVNSTNAAITFDCLNGGTGCESGGFGVDYPDMEIKGNLISGVASGHRNIEIDPRFVSGAGSIALANNGYDPDATFTYGSDMNYSAWVGASGETGSQQGTPTYVGAPDLHYAGGSSFGVNAGVCIGGITTDIDGDARPTGIACDMGGDETTSPAGSPGTLAFSSDTFDVVEAGTTSTDYNLTVCRSSGTLGAASVRVRALTGSSTATAGSCPTDDYATFANVTLSWTDGEGGCKTTPVTVCNDTNVESSEAITFTLDTFVGASGGSPATAGMVIGDNDVGAAPAFDSVTNVCRATDNTTFTLASVPAPTGSNRALVCIIATRSQITSSNGTSTGRTCDPTNAVTTWGTESMTRIGNFARVASSGASAFDHCISVWQLLAPVAAGPATVTITLQQQQQTAVFSCLALHDVFQTTAPEVVATPVALGTGTSPGSIDITTIATNSLIVDGIFLGANVTSVTPGASQTERYDNACESATVFSTSTKAQATAGATTMSHTWTGDALKTLMVAVSYKGIAAPCTPTCGNGTRECGTEACDDGDATGSDGCSATCTIEAGWLCNGASPDICIPICGDGVDVGAAEACDDGNGINTDMCTNSCLVATCGDGIVCSASACTTATGSTPEECDGSNVSQCTSGTCSGGCKCTPPTPVTEACCLNAGVCQDLTVPACASSAGVSQGSSTDCSPNPCVTTTAAPTTTTVVTTTTTLTPTTTTPPTNVGGNSAVNVQ